MWKVCLPGHKDDVFQSWAAAKGHVSVCDTTTAVTPVNVHAPITTKGHKDAWTYGHHLWLCRCPRAMPLLAPSISDWIGQLPRVMELSRLELQPGYMPRSVPVPHPGSVLTSMPPVTYLEGHMDDWGTPLGLCWGLRATLKLG